MQGCITEWHSVVLRRRKITNTINLYILIEELQTISNATLLNSYLYDADCIKPITLITYHFQFMWSLESCVYMAAQSRKVDFGANKNRLLDLGHLSMHTTQQNTLE